jgi:hypothetical protein
VPLRTTKQCWIGKSRFAIIVFSLPLPFLSLGLVIFGFEFEIEVEAQEGLSREVKKQSSVSVTDPKIVFSNGRTV